ncbi:hypothetical protein RCG19_03440 [Neobacillus sp. OS1-2]|uniref:hypothetical protein n=1 Tax=Neobacillus sp. OS1-2 TaxID=3070680 RepID=UPI0027E0DA4B|nr:hypothetical protein [Neobacillus sp. OS1-2]WML40758.1 hypothetical protein RCG19_03440 [Neobacillus sp. OS1-2]
MINLTKGVTISSHNIIDVLSMEYPFFINERDNNVEFASSFPNMMYTLWGYICTYRKFPTQSAFVAFYLLVHQEALKGYNETAVTARLLRSYPSLAREIHFFQLVKESNEFNQVSYCSYDDVEGGVDFKVTLGGIEYNICCYVETQRSLWFRNKKGFRHKNPVMNAIEMPLNLSEGKKVGNWIVYDKAQVELLLNKVINYAWVHYGQHPLELLSS